MIDLGGGIVLEDTKHIAVYKVLKSFYKTQKGFSSKVDLVKMKRLSSGYDLLDEEYYNTDTDMETIINIDTVEDGKLYFVDVINISHDYETGQVDDWDIRLSPYNEEE